MLPCTPRGRVAARPTGTSYRFGVVSAVQPAAAMGRSACGCHGPISLRLPWADQPAAAMGRSACGCLGRSACGCLGHGERRHRKHEHGETDPEAAL